ncbi:MAG: hypothetical protein ABSH53_24400 [Holophaga sp.]|jgi:hypothetical protein
MKVHAKPLQPQPTTPASALKGSRPGAAPAQGRPSAAGASLFRLPWEEASTQDRPDPHPGSGAADRDAEPQKPPAEGSADQDTVTISAAAQQALATQGPEAQARPAPLTYGPGPRLPGRGGAG